MRNRLLALVAGLAFLATPAPYQDIAAQDWRLSPSFGTVRLNANFMPDPYVVNITAGGTIPAERLGVPGCVGTIANAPDVRLHYNAGMGLPLVIMATSRRADLTLVVNLPNGRWLCNDDFIGLDPGVVMNNPMSGQYDIWVGSYDRSRGIPAQVLISEIIPR